MESTITATELAERLSDVLDRVRYRGERFVIQRDGEVIATLTPASPPPATTWSEVLIWLQDLPRPDDELADDLEAIQASQPPAEFSRWPD